MGPRTFSQSDILDGAEMPDSDSDSDSDCDGSWGETPMHVNYPQACDGSRFGFVTCPPSFRGQTESECNYENGAACGGHVESEYNNGASEQQSLAKPEKPAMAPETRLLLEHIYSSMKAKGMGVAEAALVVDVYQDVWQELTGQQPTWSSRAALDKFENVLLQAPDLFYCFRVYVPGARGANDGERMVCLVAAETSPVAAVSQ